LNFVRTISGAIATSLVTTAWQNRAIRAHAELSNVVISGGRLPPLPAGINPQMAREMLNNLVNGQSLMLATNGLMMVIAAIFLIAAVSIVLAPRASRAVDAASVGH
jgi:DHA2 family multidrug resistance protein